MKCLSAVPGGLVVLRALALPRGAPRLPDSVRFTVSQVVVPPVRWYQGDSASFSGDLRNALGYNPFALVVEVLVIPPGGTLAACLRSRSAPAVWPGGDASHLHAQCCWCSARHVGLPRAAAQRTSGMRVGPWIMWIIPL